jgi:uncharacterized protein with HEPN domain
MAGLIQAHSESADEVIFLENEMLQDALIRNFEVIGEASKNIANTASQLIQ